MPLYVKSEDVNEKADQLAMLTGKSKSDAVSDALDDALDAARREADPDAELRDLQRQVFEFTHKEAGV